MTAANPRQRLLDTAAELFYRHGIGAVGVDLISQQAGVSKRSLYQYFGSKDQLVAASLAAHGSDILGLYLPDADDTASPREQIVAAFAGLAVWSASADFRGCPFVNTATELADAGHPARRVARDFKLRLRDYFAGLGEQGGARDPQLLADQLIVVFDGAIVQAVMGTARRKGAASTAVAALLDAQGMT